MLDNVPSQEAAILVTLVLYKIVLVGVGLATQSRMRSGEAFFLGGRGLGPWVAAISGSASSSSAWTLMGVSGAAYHWGLGAVWLFPACVLGFALNWYGIAPRLRAMSAAEQTITTTDVLAVGATGVHARLVRVAASLIILLSLSTYVASQFQGAGKTFHETFGLSLPTSVMLGAAVVMVYTLLGGFWAVSITDTLQGLLMAAAAILLPVVAYSVSGWRGGPMERVVPFAVGLGLCWLGSEGAGDGRSGDNGVKFNERAV